MPIYDLKCKNCGNIIEDYFQRSLDNPLPNCDCGGEMQKLMGKICVVYKGRGFTKKVLDDIMRSPFAQSKNWKEEMIEKDREFDKKIKKNKKVV